MTPEGHPETERELTLLGLHGPAPKPSYDDGATLSLVEAAERMGVPVTRSCAGAKTAPCRMAISSVGRRGRRRCGSRLSGLRCG